MIRKLIVLTLALGAVIACAKSGVREEYTQADDGKPVLKTREYRGIDANYAYYADSLKTLAAQRKPLFELKAQPGQQITMSGVESITVDAPNNAAAQLQAPAAKPTWWDGIAKVLMAGTPIVHGVAAFHSNRDSQRTARELAEISANRDIAMNAEFGATARAGYGVLRELGASQAEHGGTHISVGPGGLYAGRDGQFGDSAGRDLLGAGANSGQHIDVSGVLVNRSTDVQSEQGAGDLLNRIAPITTTTTTTTTTDDGDDCKPDAGGAGCNLQLPEPETPAGPL
jgi:hypothetical protein